MDEKMEHTQPEVHISVETYLNHIVLGKFPARLIENRPLEDFEHDGQKYIVDLEPCDQGFIYPDADFEQMISSNPAYIKKLMDQFNRVLVHFIDVFNRVVDGDFKRLEDKLPFLQQAYLLKLNSQNEPPSSIQHCVPKIRFFRDFCYQIVQAYIAGRNPEDFKQYAATRPKNVARMRKMVSYMSLECMSKRHLYRQFIHSQNYINAHALTLLPEADLKMQLLTNLINTYNEALTAMTHSDSKRSAIARFTHLDLTLFNSYAIQKDRFEPLVLSPELTIEDVLKHFVYLLRNLDDSLRKSQTSAVLNVLRNNSFFSKSMKENTLPEALAETIQDCLNQIMPVEIGSSKLNGEQL
ncbi:hypothetical protein [Legionella sp. W05-934-2]|uniref:hypothetical protein n=1 Tax=Legionella sp. W05-934-2 TaxID=1198649 RepID=UPI0034637051